MRQSFGIKQCKKCGNTFQTDLRGGAKWCFPCKAILNREYRLKSRRSQKEQRYEAN